jgi:hypothetical protein
MINHSIGTYEFSILIGGLYFRCKYIMGCAITSNGIESQAELG